MLAQHLHPYQIIQIQIQIPKVGAKLAPALRRLPSAIGFREWLLERAPAT
jgi:hypothetical protein